MREECVRLQVGNGSCDGDIGGSLGSVWTNPGRESADLIPGTPTSKRQSRYKCCFDKLRNLVSPPFRKKLRNFRIQTDLMILRPSLLAVCYMCWIYYI